MKPAKISVLNPLAVLVDKIGFEELIRDNIRIHQASSLTTTLNDEQRLDAALQTAQLEEFAVWITEQPAGPVSVLLYPDAEQASTPMGTEYRH